MIPDHLNTTNLQLRPFVPGDGNSVYSYWKSDSGWVRFNESVPSDFTERDASDFVAEMAGRDRNLQPNWALVHQDRVVGIVSLSFDNDHRTATVGYGIHAGLRGRGFCAEAVRLVMENAFAEYGELEQIGAFTDQENSASMRVLEKLGFRENADTRGSGRMFCLRRSDVGAVFTM